MNLLHWLSVCICFVTALGQSPNISRDYSGMLGPLHLKLHLKTSPNGAIEGTLDSIDQKTVGLACTNVQQKAKELSFDVPSVGGKWRGTVSDDGSTLSGKWSQGQDIPLVFRYDEPFVGAERPSRIDGIWLGLLKVPGAHLRLQVRVRSDRSGKEYCLLDSLDQSAMGLPCDNVQFSGDHFVFEVPTVNGHWVGTLEASGKRLNGTWSQGEDLTLDFIRKERALLGKAADSSRYEAAIAAVPVTELSKVLERDLGPALMEGALASASGGGVVIGVVHMELAGPLSSVQ